MQFAPISNATESGSQNANTQTRPMNEFPEGLFDLEDEIKAIFEGYSGRIDF